uniref:Uncharacterized protein n=1 Tax=Pipistrellus kuhlii TaxID=59472 RepID=A0A7J7QVZ4_PIPKU|nr:hypothetical protein mPipKuh1_008337 [Pipistrellus kuhlii]
MAGTTPAPVIPHAIVHVQGEGTRGLTLASLQAPASDLGSEGVQVSPVTLSFLSEGLTVTTPQTRPQVLPTGLRCPCDTGSGVGPALRAVPTHPPGGQGPGCGPGHGPPCPRLPSPETASPAACSPVSAPSGHGGPGSVAATRGAGPARSAVRL